MLNYILDFVPTHFIFFYPFCRLYLLIFRKNSDEADDEEDPLDDGGPIYLDKQLGDLDEYLEEMQVRVI